MAEFCKCGSLVIGGRCTNKSCTFKSADKPVPEKPAAKKAATAEKPVVKSSRTKRASKCITYNLYETKSEEGNNF